MNAVADAGACSLGEALKSNEGLAYVYLVSCKAFAILLSVVEMLVLVTRGLQSRNAIRDAGACGLAEGLKSNKSLWVLYLVSCKAFTILLSAVEILVLVTRGLQDRNAISDAGACGLGEALKSNSWLGSLNLVSCKAFTILLSAVDMLVLVTRDLQNHNRIGDIGAYGLGEGLKLNQSLRCIHLVGVSRAA